ncbi:MAG: menaquinone-dependent protoporphyrinogen oxidase [Frankiales bacterium]|jgi:menaquinone-dependent protoporphyrinogen oxidase|nr:menaquinone-dependent protoporphyrinogen oxidase [Frankiales bacterium]
MRILVTVASRHGSTSEIADWLAAVLRTRGHDVVVQPPQQVTTLAGFDAVVLGSAIYIGGWLKQAKHFAGRFASDLGDRRLWLFSSGPVGNPLVPATPKDDMAGFVHRTGAVEHRVFPGKLDRSVLSARERIAVRAVRVGDGDYRDWDAMETWASTIADVLDRDTPVGTAGPDARHESPGATANP